MTSRRVARGWGITLNRKLLKGFWLTRTEAFEAIAKEALMLDKLHTTRKLDYEVVPVELREAMRRGKKETE